MPLVIALLVIVVVGPVVAPDSAQPASRLSLTAALVEHDSVDLGPYRGALERRLRDVPRTPAIRQGTRPADVRRSRRTRLRDSWAWSLPSAPAGRARTSGCGGSRFWSATLPFAAARRARSTWVLPLRAARRRARGDAAARLRHDAAAVRGEPVRARSRRAPRVRRVDRWRNERPSSRGEPLSRGCSRAPRCSSSTRPSRSWCVLARATCWSAIVGESSSSRPAARCRCRARLVPVAGVRRAVAHAGRVLHEPDHESGVRGGYAIPSWHDLVVDVRRRPRAVARCARSRSSASAQRDLARVDERRARFGATRDRRARGGRSRTSLLCAGWSGTPPARRLRTALPDPGAAVPRGAARGDVGPGACGRRARVDRRRARRGNGDVVGAPRVAATSGCSSVYRYNLQHHMFGPTLWNMAFGGAGTILYALTSRAAVAAPDPPPTGPEQMFARRFRSRYADER